MPGTSPTPYSASDLYSVICAFEAGRGLISEITPRPVVLTDGQNYVVVTLQSGRAASNDVSSVKSSSAMSASRSHLCHALILSQVFRGI